MSERYVLLVPGDVIQSGDETFTDGRWTPVARKWIGLAEVVLRPVRRRDHWKDRAERAEALLAEARDYVAHEAAEEANLNTHRKTQKHRERDLLAAIDAALADGEERQSWEAIKEGPQ